MRVVVNIIGVEVKLKQETLIEPVSPVFRDVLRSLKERDKGQLVRFVNDDLSLVDCSVILVNGRNLLSLNGWETQIREGDELTFMVPVAGG